MYTFVLDRVIINLSLRFLKQHFHLHRVENISICVQVSLPNQMKTNEKENL